METQRRPRGKAKDRMPTGQAEPAQSNKIDTTDIDKVPWTLTIEPTPYPGVTVADHRIQVADLAADFARLIVSSAGGFPVVDGDREFAIRTCVAQARAFYDEVYRPTSKPGQGRRVKAKAKERVEEGEEEELGVGDDYAEFFDERYDEEEG